MSDIQPPLPSIPKFTELLLKSKINFSNLYISNEGGTGLTFHYNLKPIDYLNYAKKDLKESNFRGFLNCITNAKRAIDCQTDRILNIFNLSNSKKYSAIINKFIESNNRKAKDGENRALVFVEVLGIAPIGLISKIRNLRNKLEHYYERPSEIEAQEAIELAELYVNATQNKITFANEILFGTEESINGDARNWEGFNVYFQPDLKNIRVTFYLENVDNVIFTQDDLEFYHFLKITLTYNDEDSVAESLSHLLKYLQHPQANSVIKVTCEN
ncbi:hypothetical protein [Mucilaginibacter defluvii]|uniref:Uncharacterized protein n=1 Tax=Mucilaginibacter defluvii TaxID=1196019 RepID=A0ABP9FKW9_9SPHI